MSEAKDQLKALLKATLKEVGVELQDQLDELVAYTTERVEHLNTLVGQEGFDAAVLVERDNVLLKAANLATTQADAWDAKIVGVVQGALYILAAAV